MYTLKSSICEKMASTPDLGLMRCYISSCLSCSFPIMLTRFGNFTDTSMDHLLFLTAPQTSWINSAISFSQISSALTVAAVTEVLKSIRCSDVLLYVYHLFVFHFINLMHCHMNIQNGCVQAKHARRHISESFFPDNLLTLKCEARKFGNENKIC